MKLIGIKMDKRERKAVIVITFIIIVVAILLIGMNEEEKNGEDLILNKEVCENEGGKWNECGSKCAINNQGKEGVYCPAVCDPICVCGTITGLGCPSSYDCIMPRGVADAQGYCGRER
jgi:hypothetical protein